MNDNSHIANSESKPWCLFLGVLGCLLFSIGSSAQTSMAGNEIGNSFNQYRSRYIREKLFVHTDKNNYISREICWFRIYYVDAFYNKPASLSKIAYIEILDRNNRPVLQEKVSLKAGESNGSLIIPVNIPTGNYRLRAYTSWMKNFPPADYFEKTIRIVNPQDLKRDSVSISSKQYDIQFFPEGGNLVQDIESRVAFRITDSYGRGLDCDGSLLNLKGDTLLRFHPLHNGLGNFTFKPAAGQTYKALIRFPGGEQVIKELPASYDHGFVMRISGSVENSITIQVTASNNLEGQDIYLFVHGSHSALPVKKEVLAGQTVNFFIDAKDLDDGISQFTVFNKDGEPVCERLYFKYPERNLAITAEANPEYGTRQKVDLNLTVTDQSGEHVEADMSLAVYRLDSLQGVDETDIRNYLYLSSELGPVESPGFYFKDNGVSTRTEMDNLMMTHGWRRFNWKDIMQKNSAAMLFPLEYNGHYIQGNLVNNRNGSPVPYENVYLSVPSTRTQFRATTSDESGHVKFEMPGFYGSSEIIIQLDPKDDTICHLEIYSPFSDKYTGQLLPPFSGVSGYSATLLDHTIDEQVRHIYTGMQLNQFTRQPVDTNPFYVVPDEKYMLDDYTRFMTMEEVLREYVRSVNVIGKRDKFELKLIDNPHKTYFEGDPLILIDGIPFFDVNELFQQDPKKIRRLDLMNREYAIGNQVFDGVVNLTTYQGDLNGIRMNAHVSVLDYPGIPEQREFFSPQYETEKQVNSRMPDFRTLLYWSPNIKSDAGDKQPINFYSSDIPGKYAVVIQGLSETGIPASHVVFFTVRK